MQTYRIAHELSDNLTMKEYYLKSDVVARDAKIREKLLELSRLYCDKRFKELEVLLGGVNSEEMKTDYSQEFSTFFYIYGRGRVI